MTTRIVIGNWKMNLTLPEAIALAQSCVHGAEKFEQLTIVIAPSLPYLIPIRESFRLMPPHFSLASQVVSQHPEGAYTGEVSAQQLKGLVKYCLVGHSERRRYHHETGGVISEMIIQLLEVGIHPVVCFGEMSQSRNQELSSQVTLDLSRDLHALKKEEIAKCLFAYEPLWAIGTGNPATPEYVKKVIRHMKQWFKKEYEHEATLLYGGSVTEEDAADLSKIRDLDGVLVGGASIHSKSFREICRAFSPGV